VRQSAASLPMALDFLTWPATFGSGLPIGTDRITTKRLRQQIRLRGIPKDRPTASTRRSRAWQSAFTKVGRFFVPTSIALATCLVVAAKASLILARTILDFAACVQRSNYFYIVSRGVASLVKQLV
jgi:hypothetical protein